MLKFKQLKEMLSESKQHEVQDVHDENGKLIGKIRNVGPGKWRTEHVDPDRKPITASSIKAARDYILPYKEENKLFEMKRFKQWLQENPEIISNTFTDFNDTEQYPIRRKEITKKIKSLNHISTMPNGIKIYHKRYKYPGDPYESEQEFHAFDTKKNKFVARVSILTHPNGQHKVTNAEKHPYSDLEMGDLYRHITKKHLGNLNSDTQHSIGSVKNWENITNKPGKGFKVTKHEYDSEDGTLSKEVPMKRGKEFRKNYTGKNRFHTFFRLSYRGKIANSLKEFKQWLEESKKITFFYHGTPAKNLESIQEFGLRPNEHGNPLNFAWSENAASYYKKGEGHLLRVHKDLLPTNITHDSLTHRSWTNETISPHHIEIKKGGEWVSLKDNQ